MHFSVAVITEGVPSFSQIEDMLAPFQENNMGTCPQEFLKFFEDEIEDYKDDYENEILTKYKLTDGSYVNDINDRNRLHVDAVKIEIPAKILYPTFNDYLIKEIGLYYDEGEQKFGYWANPDSEWDWYSISGRWTGYLRFPKDNKHCIQYSLDDDKAYESKKYKLADSGRVKDVILEPDAEEKRLSALEWELKVDKKPPKNQYEEDILKQMQFMSDTYLKNVYQTKNKYVKECRHLSTHAIINKEGLWFTIDSNVEEFKRLVVDEAKKNDYITIVDCHI